MPLAPGTTLPPDVAPMTDLVRFPSMYRERLLCRQSYEVAAYTCLLQVICCASTLRCCRESWQMYDRIRFRFAVLLCSWSQ